MPSRKAKPPNNEPVRKLGSAAPIAKMTPSGTKSTAKKAAAPSSSRKGKAPANEPNPTPPAAPVPKITFRTNVAPHAAPVANVAYGSAKAESKKAEPSSLSAASMTNTNSKGKAKLLPKHFNRSLSSGALAANTSTEPKGQDSMPSSSSLQRCKGKGKEKCADEGPYEWSYALDQYTLLATQYVIEKHYKEFPWEEVGIQIRPGCTAEQVLQHLQKIRKKRLSEGEEIAPGPAYFPTEEEMAGSNKQAARAFGTRYHPKRAQPYYSVKDSNDEPDDPLDATDPEADYIAPKTRSGTKKKVAFAPDVQIKTDPSPSQAGKSSQAPRSSKASRTQPTPIKSNLPKPMRSILSRRRGSRPGMPRPKISNTSRSRQKAKAARRSNKNSGYDAASDPFHNATSQTRAGMAYSNAYQRPDDEVMQDADGSPESVVPASYPISAPALQASSYGGLVPVNYGQQRFLQAQQTRSGTNKGALASSRSLQTMINKSCQNDNHVDHFDQAFYADGRFVPDDEACPPNGEQPLDQNMNGNIYHTNTSAGAYNGRDNDRSQRHPGDELVAIGLHDTNISSNVQNVSSRQINQRGSSGQYNSNVAAIDQGVNPFHVNGGNGQTAQQQPPLPLLNQPYIVTQYIYNPEVGELQGGTINTYPGANQNAQQQMPNINQPYVVTQYIHNPAPGELPSGIHHGGNGMNKQLPQPNDVYIAPHTMHNPMAGGIHSGNYQAGDMVQQTPNTNQGYLATPYPMAGTLHNGMENGVVGNNPGQVYSNFRNGKGVKNLGPSVGEYQDRTANNDNDQVTGDAQTLATNNNGQQALQESRQEEMANNAYGQMYVGTQLSAQNQQQIQTSARYINRNPYGVANGDQQVVDLAGYADNNTHGQMLVDPRATMIVPDHQQVDVSSGYMTSNTHGQPLLHSNLSNQQANHPTAYANNPQGQNIVDSNMPSHGNQQDLSPLGHQNSNQHGQMLSNPHQFMHDNQNRDSSGYQNKQNVATYSNNEYSNNGQNLPMNAHSGLGITGLGGRAYALGAQTDVMSGNASADDEVMRDIDGGQYDAKYLSTDHDNVQDIGSRSHVPSLNAAVETFSPFEVYINQFPD